MGILEPEKDLGNPLVKTSHFMDEEMEAQRNRITWPTAIKVRGGAGIFKMSQKVRTSEMVLCLTVPIFSLCSSVTTSSLKNRRIRGSIGLGSPQFSTPGSSHPAIT